MLFVNFTLFVCLYSALAQLWHCNRFFYFFCNNNNNNNNKRNLCHHKPGSLGSSVAPGQLTSEGGRAGCASRYFTICFFSIRRKYRRSPAAAVTSQSDVATTDTAVSLAKNIWSSAVHNSPLSTGLSAHKQSAWDKPIMASERLELNNSLRNPADQARLLTTTSLHSGDWLYALPLSRCGLRVDNPAVHVAVGLRLGANICEPHQCPCGATLDAKGLHGCHAKADLAGLCAIMLLMI